MSALNRICLYVALAAGALLTLWYVIAFKAEAQDYLSLVRAGFLLIGLGAVAWGFLWHRPHLAWVGAAFLAIGFLTFFIDVDPQTGWGGSLECVSGQEWFQQVREGLSEPLTRSGRVCLWHLALAGLIATNAILIGNHADGRRLVAANVLLLVVIGLAALLVA